MPNAAQEQEPVPPGEKLANVAPDISGATAQTRLVIIAIEASIKDLKDDVREIKSNRHSDFVYMISVFAAGFLLLAGMLIAGYLRLDDRIVELTKSSVRVDTKLEDLLQRIPAIPTPPPKRGEKSN
jgi:hypothetical protein